LSENFTLGWKIFATWIFFNLKSIPYKISTKFAYLYAKAHQAPGFLVLNYSGAIMKKTALQLAASVALGVASTASLAAPVFYSTADASHWEVVGSSRVTGFVETGFVEATAVTNFPGPGSRWNNTLSWISPNANGTSSGDWYYNYRQSFDLTGYDPATAILQFQLATDDVFHGYRLNGGILTSAGGTNQINLGPIITVTGFSDGLNTLNFYIDDSGRWNTGIALQIVSFTAQELGVVTTVPEPETGILLLAGVGIMGLLARRRKDRSGAC
jgi:hypothetical protein